MRRPRLLIALALLALWGQSALFTVDRSDFAQVTRFGRPLEVLDGAADAGLHLKCPWPIDGVQRLDRRMQSFDLPSAESLTRDPASGTVDKTLTVDAFVCWRVPDREAAGRFLRTVRTAEQAQNLLAPRIGSRLAALISALPLDAWIAAADDAALEERAARMHERLQGADAAEGSPAAILRDYGIELVEVRLRRFSYPEAVRGSIAERIRSERQRRVADYQSEGARKAAAIVSDAEREAATAVAEARAERQRVEGAAEVEADAIRNAAQVRDPEFYAFLQKLKAYQALLADSKDTLLLSGKHELFELFLTPPKGQ